MLHVGIMLPDQNTRSMIFVIYGGEGSKQSSAEEDKGRPI